MCWTLRTTSGGNPIGITGLAVMSRRGWRTWARGVRPVGISTTSCETSPTTLCALAAASASLRAGATGHRPRGRHEDARRLPGCRRATSWSPIWRSTHRRRRVAGGPTQPAPPARAPHRLSASCGAPPRKRASGGPAGETGLDTRQPAGLADETRAPPGPPAAHGARPRRRSHIRGDDTESEEPQGTSGLVAN